MSTSNRGSRGARLSANFALAIVLLTVAACAGPAAPGSAPKANEATKAPVAATDSAANKAAEATRAPGAAATAAPTVAEPQAQPTLVPAANAVTLNYWDMQWGGAALMNQIQDNVTEFNKTHPNIYVKFTQLSWGDYTQKILAATQAGNPPDISGGDSGIPFNMDAQGQALDISDVYADWQSNGALKDMVPWAYNKWNYQGKKVGITWQFDVRAIYYRKDLLDQAGIKPPTTWDELLAAAKKLNNPDKGMIGIAIPGKQGSYDTDQFYMTLVLQAGGGLADAQGNPTFDTPQQLQALQFEKQLVDCCVAKGTPSWTFTEVQKAYEQGQAAMAFEGGWLIADLKKNFPKLYENTGILPVLMGPGGQQAQHMVAFANPWMIYKQTKHPQEAKEFLKWMMQKENLRKLYDAEPGGKWPVYQDLVNDPIYQSDPLASVLAKELTQSGIDYWYPNNNAAVGIGSLGTSIADIIVNPVVSGQRQPQDVLKDAQTKLTPLFRKQG